MKTYRLLFAIFCLIINVSLVQAQVQVDLGSDTTICHGTSITIDVSQTGGNIYTYAWSSNIVNLTLDSIATQTLNQSGTYYVEVKDTVTDTTGYDTLTLTVIPLPSFGVEVSGICQGTTTTFMNDSAVVHRQYIWDFGDGNTDTSYLENNITHNYSNPSSYQVILTTIDTLGSCSRMDTIPVTIFSTPSFGVQVADVCLGETTIFNNDSIVNNTTQYIWNFGDGNMDTSYVEVNIPHDYNNDSTYQVILTALDTLSGCTRVDTFSTIVHFQPSADFVADSTCIGDSILISNLSTTNDSSIFIVDYSLNVDTIFNSPNSWYYSYSNIGSQTILIDIQNNQCFSKDTLNSVIYALPTVSVGNDMDVCHNPNPKDIILPMGTPTNGYWTGKGIVDSLQGIFRTDAPEFSYPLIYHPNDTIGMDTLVYHFTDTTTLCSNTDTLIVTIFAPDTLTIPGIDTVCIDANTYTLTGYLPSGGTWIIGDSIEQITPTVNLSDLGIGLHSIIYTLNDSTCQVYDTTSLYIAPLPTVQIGHDFTICFNDQDTTLTGTPAGGIWSGIGVDDTLGIFSPSVANVGSHMLIYTYTNPNTLCQAEDTINITVQGIPTASINVDNSCSNDSVRFTRNISMDYTLQYAWDFGDGTSISNRTDSIFKYPYTNIGEYQVILEVSDTNGCAVRDTAIAGYYAIPTASFVLDLDTVCLNSPNRLINTSMNVDTATNYLIHWGDGTSSNSLNIDTSYHTYSNDGSFSLWMEVTNGGICSDTTLLDTAVVKPGPTIDVTISEACFGGFNTVINNSIADATSTYSWDYGNGITNDTSASMFNIFYIGVDTFDVILTISSDSLLCAHTDTIPAIVLSNPNAGLTSDTVCYRDSTTFINVSDSIYSSTMYIFDFGNGDTDTIIGFDTIRYAYSYADTFPVTMISNTGGCIDTLSNNVLTVVKTSPTASYTVDSVCNGNSVTFDNNSTASSTSIYTWTFGDDSTQVDSTKMNVIYDYGAVGQYHTMLSIVDTNGCSHIDSGITLVRLVPTVLFTADTICFGDMAKITNQSIDTEETVYYIDYGDGSPIDTLLNGFEQPIYHLYNAVNSYNVKVIAENGGCLDSNTNVVIVKEQPIANFTSIESCFGNPTTFNNTSQSTLVGVTYSWDFGDNNMFDTTSLNFGYVYNQNGGLFNVQLIANNQNGCADTIINQVEVHQQPTANFFALAEGCDAVQVEFTDSSTNTTDTVLYSINYGNGFSNIDTFLQPFYTYPLPNIYNAVLTVDNQNGCTSTFSKNVLIKEQPKIASITVDSVCFGNISLFNHVTTAIDTAWYIWSYGDGLRDTLDKFDNNISHLYNTNNQIFTATLEIDNRNGCTEVQNVNAVILQEPNAQFSVDTSMIVCADNIYNLIDETSQVASQATFIFNYGNSLTDSIYNSFTPQFSYSSEGTYVIELTIDNNNGCIDSYFDTVAVQRQPTANLSITPTVCFGETLNINNATSNTTGNVQYYFDYDYNGTHNLLYTLGHAGSYSYDSYPSHGTYILKTIVDNKNGCFSEDLDTFIVNYQPTANFFVDSVCFGEASIVVDSSDFLDSATYYWSYGDSSFDTLTQTQVTNVPHFYTQNNQTYTIQLILDNNNGCDDTHTFDAVVKQEPNVDFTVLDVCDGTFVNITNISSDMSSNADFYLNYDYNLNSNQDTLASQLNYFHLYDSASIYVIRMEINNNNGCIDEYFDTLQVHSQPIAVFAADTVCHSDSTTFIHTSTSTDTASYYWSFGDNTFDTTSIFDTAFKHYYLNNNSINLVTLTIDNHNGCTNSVTEDVKVKFQPYPMYSVTTECWKDSTTFTHNSIARDTALYIWSFGDGDTSNTQNMSFTHFYDTNGVVLQSSLFIDNKNGCTNLMQLPVTMKITPIADFTIDTVCHHLPNTLVNHSTFRGTNVSFRVNYDNNDITTYTNSQFLDTIQYTYQNYGVYNVQLYVDNQNGCQDSIYVTGKVHQLPDVYFTDTLEYSEYCAEDGIDLIAGSLAPGYFYSPNHPDSNIIMFNYDTLQGVSLTGTGAFSPSTADTNIILIYTHTDTNMCVNYDTQYVNIVRALPKPYFLSTVPLEYCVGVDGPIDLEADLFNNTEFTIEQVITNFYIDTSLGGGIPELVIDSVSGDPYAIFDPIQTDTSIFLIVEVQDTHQCGNFAFKELTIHRLPPIEMPEVDSIDSGDPPATIGTDSTQTYYTYLWSTGATTDTISVINAGYYTLTVTNTITGCVNADTIEFKVLADDYEVDVVERVLLFPNPVQTYLNFDIKFKDRALVEASNIMIYNSIGKEVYTENRTIYNSQNNQIDVSFLPSGVYFLNIMIENKLLTIEFLKE